MSKFEIEEPGYSYPMDDDGGSMSGGTRQCLTAVLAVFVLGLLLMVILLPLSFGDVEYYQVSNYYYK